MPFNGSGLFTRLYSWVSDAANGVNMSPVEFDNDGNDVAAALNNCITRDGQGGPTQDIPWAGHKITNLGAPTNAGDAVSLTYVTSSVWSTGDVKLTLKQVADAGWVLMNDGTVGNGASAATARANADTSNLFALLWGFSDANCPLLTSSGAATTRSAQGTAASAFAANCQMSLPRVLGRALAAAGTGTGLTARTLAGYDGAESYALAIANLPSHTHGVNDGGHAHSIYDPTHNHSLNDPGHNHYLNDPSHSHTVYDPTHAHTYDAVAVQGGAQTAGYNVAKMTGAHAGATQNAATGVSNYASGTGCYNSAATTGCYNSAAATGIGIYANVTGISIQYTGSGTALSVMNPRSYLNVMLKL